MNSTARPHPMASAPVEDYQARLIVMDGEHLPMLGRFFRAMLLNFLKQPGKVRAIKHLNLKVAFIPTGHAENAMTLTFARGRVILESGVASRPDIRIKGEPAVLMKLARLPAGPPVIRFLMQPEGKDLIARVRMGELKIRGIVRHPLGMMRFSQFMAPNVM